MKEKHSRSENNKIVRSQNIETIIRLMQRHDPVTTDFLVKRSGLSYPTVFGIIKDLLEAGIAEQLGYASSTGGRQAHLYSICASCAYTLGVHITPAWINLALTNVKGGIVYEKQFLHEGISPNLPESVITAIELALNHVGIPGEKLLAVCLCMSPVFQSLLREQALDLCAAVTQRLHIHTEMVSDSTVQGFLDWETLSCSGTQSCLHVVFGDSVQGAMYLPSGERAELPGTLSHITIFPRGAQCSCGKRGCLETYYNGAELLRNYNALREKHQLAPFSDEIMQDHRLFRRLLSRSLLQDACATEALESATEALAIMLSNLIILAGEFRVVLSGLYSSNDSRNFQKLHAAVLENLPTADRPRLDLSMGLALPVECALGASRMMTSQHTCQISKRFDKMK